MFQKMSEKGLAAIAAMQGGAVDERFIRLFRLAVQDCDDRPGETKARKITLQVELTPVPQGHGHAPHVEISAGLKSAIPDYRSAPTEAKVMHGGDAVFNDLAPDNPDQRTFDEPEADEANPPRAGA